MKNNPFSAKISVTSAQIASFFIKYAAAGLFCAGIFGMSVANAATTPTLTLTANGNGSVQAIVAGDPNASIQLFYASGASSAPLQSAGVIGSTGQNGYLSTTLYTYPNSTSGIYNYNYYNIPAGSPVYVVVDGLQSSSVPWPYSGNGTGTGTGTNGTLTFSQTNVSLTPGQSVVVSVYNSANYNYSTTYPLTVSGNTNPSVASATSLTGNTITIIGQSYGSTVLTICSNVNGSVCGTIYVTVSSSGTVTSPTNGPIYFNISSINLTAGQSQSVQIYQNASNAYSGSYYISSNSNPSMVTATINGSYLYVTANAPGTDTITVCQNGGSYVNSYANGVCATLTVTVNYANGGYNGGTYPSYPTYPTYPTPAYPTYPTIGAYVNPVIQQIQAPLYIPNIPATVYQAPSYSAYPSYSSYPTYQGYSGYSSGYGYSNSQFYPYY